MKSILEKRGFVVLESNNKLYVYAERELAYVIETSGLINVRGYNGYASVELNDQNELSLWLDM